MKSSIQWKRFPGLIRQSIINIFCQQRSFSIFKFLILRIKKKKALIPFWTTQKFWKFNGISFVSTKTPTHFFACRVLISRDGILKVNGIFYFSEWLFYFASFLKLFFQSNFGRDGFFKTRNCEKTLFCRDRSQMQVHKKLIYNRELQFWQRLQKTDIVPLVLSIQPMGSSQYLLSTKRYPMTLQAWMCDHASDQKYLCKLPALVNKLHKRGIIHGDLACW